jgi:hypothetical protein
MSQKTEDRNPTADPVNKKEASDSRLGVSRRRMLATGAATWATVLAGCSGGDGEDTSTPEDTPTATPEDTATPDEETPEPEPEPQPENFVVTAETLAGGGAPSAASFISGCAATNVFVPGMTVVFHVGIYDPATGDKLTDEDLDSVTIDMNGQTIDLSWSSDYGWAQREEGNEWIGTYDISEDILSDQESANMTYTVNVSGADGNFETVGVLSDNVEVVPYEDPRNYVVTTNTFWNGHPSPEESNGFVGSCAPERQFTQDLDVTFVIGIYDSTNGYLVGTDGTYTPNGDKQADSPAISEATVVSPNGEFDDVSLTWNDFADDDNSTARWNGVLETETLSPGTYNYEVEVTEAEESERGRVNATIASNYFTIIEVSGN